MVDYEHARAVVLLSPPADHAISMHDDDVILTASDMRNSTAKNVISTAQYRTDPWKKRITIQFIVTDHVYSRAELSNRQPQGGQESTPSLHLCSPLSPIRHNTYNCFAHTFEL